MTSKRTAKLLSGLSKQQRTEKFKRWGTLSKIRSAQPQVRKYLQDAGIEPEPKKSKMFRQFLLLFGIETITNRDTDTQIIKLYDDESFPHIGRLTDQQFYFSPEWLCLRRKVLDRYGCHCMKCGSPDHIAVDHIKPRSLYPELELEETNTQVLCRKCNSSKSNRHEKDFRECPAEPKASQIQAAKPILPKLAKLPPMAIGDTVWLNKELATITAIEDTYVTVSRKNRKPTRVHRKYIMRRDPNKQRHEYLTESQSA